MAAVALAIVGCSPGSRTASSASDDSATSLVRTDRDVYLATVDSAAVRFTVVVTLANRTADTLTVHPCDEMPPVSFERLEGGKSTVPRAIFGSYCPDVLIWDPPRLAPGQARVDTVEAWLSLLPNVGPLVPPGPIEASYRVVYGGVYRTWHPGSITPDGRSDVGEPVADSLLVSPPFQVVTRLRR